jgi:hypothetical protein
MLRANEQNDQHLLNESSITHIKQNTYIYDVKNLNFVILTVQLLVTIRVV